MKRNEPKWKRQMARIMIQIEKQKVWNRLSKPEPHDFTSFFEDLAGVQPMTAPTGKVFTIRKKYETK